MTPKTLGIFLLSMLVTFASLFLLRKLAFALDILDYPGGRKVHKEATPLVGGMGIYLGLITGLFFYADRLTPFLPVFIGAAVIFIIGMIEDIHGLSAQARFVLQTAVAVYLITQGIRISFLPDTLWGNSLEIILTIFWLVGVTNAYNYLDGLDGLAAGSAVINFTFFTWILFFSAQYIPSKITMIFVAVCLGFLPHNFRRRGKIFLGEAGSTFLGFLLAGTALVGNWAHDSMVKLAIPILILGVPIFDMIFTTIIRIKDEKVKSVIEWLRYGGKDHFHHFLVDVGLTPVHAVVFIWGVTASLGISAIMLTNDSGFEVFLSLCQASIVFGVIATLIVVGKNRRSGWKK